ncbi:Membrane protein involved in the export of O-antigen and teichoic acid [Devosia enhydra]|uniref:Membrane protein involved in the export of O-antigen and teichoic acid n=1 Tax=Devosia enhydra TaxID=665118 RepID=A0A1K2HX30_9HYPH|nr:polysaccharide biosynthesis C-terminal domain-containing protein [Devosia enhydra]SFZ82745.1 Membrane protein involved in the export of O-antigen and teichoic acid [Devosia enhydra]
MGIKGRLASQSAIIFAARIGGAGVTFLAQAAIARLWGAPVLGEYLLLLAAINLLAVALPLGFQAVGTYFSAEYAAAQDGHMLWRFIGHAYVYIAAMAILAGVLLPVIAPLLGEPGQALAGHLVPAVVMAAGTALVFFNGAVLIGLKRPLWGFTADTLFRPFVLVTSLIVAALLAHGDGPLALVLLIGIFAFGYAGLSLVHLLFVVQAARTVPKEKPPRAAPVARWWRFSVPLVLIGLATDFYFDIDLLLLAGHMSREELAIFGVCARVFALVSFGVVAVYSVIVPDIFEAGGRDDRAGFARKIGDANLVACGLALVLCAGMAIGGPLMLMLFGPDFAPGYGPLLILCLALVVRSAFGPAALVLSMHDKPHLSLPGVTLGMVVLVLGNQILVPEHGLMGAALAALASITAWSFALWATARLATGIDVSIIARWRQRAAH